MDKEKLKEILSKFQMPQGEYSIESEGDFGESENYWVIAEEETNAKYLLVSTYWHPGIEKEMDFYRKNGFNVKNPILRDFGSLEVAADKDDPNLKYQYFCEYSIFLL